MNRRVTRVVIVAVLIVAAGGAFLAFGRGIWYPLLLQVRGARSVADAVAKYGPDARARLGPHFRRAGVVYPPKEIAILGFKEEKRVAIWARDGARWRFIRDYPVLAASGHAGPKLREGDRQVPEGVYRIAHLNPNSSYHLSMKVSYPNAFDQRMAKRDGRTRLGDDIFIHGKAVSIGCLALGDRAIEELFTLVAETGHARVQVVIAPNDLRVRGPIVHEDTPRWAGELYRTIIAALSPFPIALESGSAVDVRGMEPKVRLIK
ncbi:MAG TPA: L,D-transpeptidase family protein [Thermoanaerobaculia bacterium]|nr:L,D-transpeptidase family protein [Thermoanaerobaculia bacterium]